MIEVGIVRTTEARLAAVEIESADSCDSCSSRFFCQIEEKKSKQIVAAHNELRAAVGDRVEVVVAARHLIFSALLIFILPLLGLIGGYYWGMRYGQGWGILLAVLGMGAGLGLLRWLDSLVQRKRDWRPVITRIIQRNTNSLG